MSDTTTTITVDPVVWARFVAVERDGEKPSVIAKRDGITGSTVSAGNKRIREHIASGGVVTVDGKPVTLDGSPTTDGADAPTVDPVAIADGMVPGAGIIVHRLGALEAEYNALEAKHDANVNRAMAARTAALDAAMVTLNAERERVAIVADALSFDVDAWRAAVADATPEPTTDGDDADAPTDTTDGDDA